MNTENHPVDETKSNNSIIPFIPLKICNGTSPVTSSERSTSKFEIWDTKCPISNLRWFKYKKRNNIKMAALYDNMISATYTLHNGELDKEKIENQKVSFAAHKS